MPWPGSTARPLVSHRNRPPFPKLPGRPFEGSLSVGESVRIMTGAPLPEGADAVLPVELVELEGRRILAQGEVSPGKHVGRIGEDIAAGATLFPPGRFFGPQDNGGLAAGGGGGGP